MANLPVPNEQTWISYEVPGASSGPFPFNFSIFEKANLRVKVGATELAQNEFTFTGTRIDSGYDGGSITLTTAAENETVMIWREVEPERLTDYSPSSSVPVKDLDAALDLLTAQVQDVRRDVDRSFKLPLGSDDPDEQTFDDVVEAFVEAVSADARALVQDEGQEQILAVEETGAAQIAEVEAAGADQVAAVEAAGDDQIALVAATVAAGIYADTTAGLAAVAEGEYFVVPVATGFEVFKDVAGVAVSQGVFAKVSELNTFMTLVNAHEAELGEIDIEAMTELSGWRFAIGALDADGLTRRVVFGIRDDGTIFANVDPRQPPAESSDYFVTSHKDADGNYQLRSFNKATGQVVALTTANNNLYPRVTEGGVVAFYRPDVTGLTPPERWVPADGGAEYAFVPGTRVRALGDSMTFGVNGTPYPTHLDTVLASEWSIYNDGITGQKSDHIAARMGAVDTLITVTGNTAPAAGSVAVTAMTIGGAQADKGARNFVTPSNPGAQGVGPLANTTSRSLSGTVLGQAATLSVDANGCYTLALVGAADDLAVPAGTPFVIDQGDYADRVYLIWVGRNNYSEPLQVAADVAAIVASMKAQIRQYIVIGVLNSRTETTGSAAVIAIDALNATLAATYGDRFLNIRSVFIDDGAEGGLALAGVTPTAQDLIDIAAGAPPDSLMGADNLHTSNEGNLAVAMAVQAVMDARGWTL